MLRARNHAFQLRTQPPVSLPEPVAANPCFTLDDWRAESALRETVDLIRLSIRWRVLVDLGDGSPRLHYLHGDHDDVRHRAKLFYRNSRSITLEPAGLRGDINGRLASLITS